MWCISKLDRIINNFKKLKTNYFYIDESGNILNHEKLFIHGCIKTDTPISLATVMNEIRSEINDEPLFESFWKKFQVSGFHAVDNYPDIRTVLYRRLHKLNWRAYFVLINKESDFFKSIKNRDEHEIFAISLSKLLYNRIRSSKNDKNIFIFETIQLQSKSLKFVLDTFFEQMMKNNYICEYRIVEKEDDINLGIIDYLLYMIHSILTKNQYHLRMQEIFKVFAPKIAMIHIQNSNKYLSRINEDINVEDLIKNW